MTIPKTENALVLRTDFSNQAVWKKICDIILRPVGIFRFRANVEFLDDRVYEGITVAQLIELLPKDYENTFIFLIDQTTIRLQDHPILVVDLYDQRGRSFRAVPEEIWAIENNLSIANMDFDEFANAVDDDGVFRGFDRS